MFRMSCMSVYLECMYLKNVGFLFLLSNIALEI